MRSLADAERIRRFLETLGRRTGGPGRIYLAGGATAVLLGWRETTVDVNLKIEPEPPGVFPAIARLKEELDINVELASPDDFIPPLPGWVERSLFIATFAEVSCYHYDLYGQALAKIERGHVQDRHDVTEMLARKLVSPERLRELFDAIVPAMERYPALHPEAFRARLAEALS